MINQDSNISESKSGKVEPTMTGDHSENVLVQVQPKTKWDDFL